MAKVTDALMRPNAFIGSFISHNMNDFLNGMTALFNPLLATDFFFVLL